MLKFLNLSLLLITIVFTSSIILFYNHSNAFEELENNASSLSSLSPSSSSNQVTPTYSKLSPTYKIDITTGSGVSFKFQHFYPLKITIPVNTTVAWFSGDPEQIHTVTSGPPGASTSGKLFNSGIITYSSSFQYTFEQPGMVSYHCEIHPWMIGSVYVSDSTKQGKNFKLSTGTRMGELDTASQNNDWVFNTTDIDRILFHIQPTSIKADKNTTMTYNIQIYNSQLNEEVLSQTFFVKGNDLQFELLASDLDKPLVYGPDFSDPISGAYHIRENFPNGDYILMVEITAIGPDLINTKTVDVFKGKIIS
jgi:plastocyanin